MALTKAPYKVVHPKMTTSPPGDCIAVDRREGPAVSCLAVPSISKSSSSSSSGTISTVDDPPAPLASGREIFMHAIIDEMKKMASVHLSGRSRTGKDYDDDQVDKNLYLDMTITRSGSMLPSDVVSIAVDGLIRLAPVPSSSEDERSTSSADDKSTVRDAPSQEPTTVPWYAYLLLAGSVVALASFGPVLALQVGVSGSMKTVWRQLLTSFVFFPFMAHEVYQHGFPVLSTTQWSLFGLACLFYSGMGVGFVTALEYVSVGICVILANSQCLILLASKAFVGSPLSSMEVSGALIAFAGTVLVSVDSERRNDEDEDDSNFLLGVTLAFVFAGCGGVGYLLSAKVVRTDVPLFTFMFLVMIGGCFVILPFQKLVLGEDVTFDRDVNCGIWGFLSWRTDRLPNDLIQVVFGNLIGTVGQIASMRFFDPLVVTVACLMQPVIAELLASAVGVSPLPGWTGWVGNVAVVAGTLVVVAPPSFGSCAVRKKKKKYDEEGRPQLDEKLVVDKEVV